MLTKWNIDELLDLYNEGFTVRGISKQFGVTPQRIRQLLSQHHNYIPHREQYKQKILQLKEQGLSQVQIVKKLGLSPGCVSRHFGQSSLKPIGCKDCKIKPAFRGLCYNCYTRWLNRGKPNVEALKPDKRFNGKILAIGCNKCKENPCARGLCQRCYARARSQGKIKNYPLMRGGPIGPGNCDDCDNKINIYAKSMCRRCYYNDYWRKTHQ